jgi:hypothetical protein
MRLGRTRLVIASEAKQSRSRRGALRTSGSPRRFAPRDDDSIRASRSGALWAWVSPEPERLTSDGMGERAYRVCTPLAAILPAPSNNFSVLRPLLVPPLKKGERRIGSSTVLTYYKCNRLRLYRKATRSRTSAARTEMTAVRMTSGRKGILINLPVLHDDEEILLRVFDERDVGDRIAVDHDEVSQRTLFDESELPRIGIA